MRFLNAYFALLGGGEHPAFTDVVEESSLALAKRAAKKKTAKDTKVVHYKSKTVKFILPDKSEWYFFLLKVIFYGLNKLWTLVLENSKINITQLTRWSAGSITPGQCQSVFTSPISSLYFLRLSSSITRLLKRSILPSVKNTRVIIIIIINN